MKERKRDGWIDRRLERHQEGKEGKKDRQMIEGWREGRKEGDGWKGKKVERVDGWKKVGEVDGQQKGQMNERMGGKKDRWIERKQE